MEVESKIAPRIPLAIEVDFRKSYSRQSTKAHLKNVSLSGAFLETNHGELAHGDKIQVQLVVGSRSRKINALIIWKNQYGVGVKFYHSNNRDMQIIDDLMYFAENKRNTQKDLMGDIFNKVG